jgi:alkylation response protein AidB-like acyl-CoA dehydrogenase
MNQYTPPVEELLFVIDKVLNASEQWVNIPAFEDMDMDLAQEVINQAGRFAAEVISPINLSGDSEGCTWSPDTGAVTTPTGYVDAWKQFVEGGWPALACDPEFGGQGLPQLLNAAVFEMLGGANDAWVMYSGVLHGAYESLIHHGSDYVREQFLEKIVSGEWLATMALTEPQAGSDLALLRAKAEPVAEGDINNGDEVLVSGNKIFISGGDQDMTENIVHLVLARLPGGPAGTKGLSLIMVPKILPEGGENTVYCDGIEKKMGLKGSSTCQLRFEKAKGWLVGEPHTGLAAMFLMMNAARLHVGVKCVGHMENARQQAYHYAFDRRQSKSPTRPEGEGSEGADLIAWQPAIRHKLWRLSAKTQAARVLALWATSLLDEQEHGADEVSKKECGQLAALLTPIVKGFITDTTFFACDEALGVFGGYGYIHEYGIEQHVRDVRVTRLYEGSNEIQAIDLVMRKLLGRNSALPQLLDEFEEIAIICSDLAGQDDDIFGEALQLAEEKVLQQKEAIERAVITLTEAAQTDPEAPFRVADDMLQAMGHAMFTLAWAKILVATSDLPKSDFRIQQRKLSHYGLEWLSESADTHWQRVENWQRVLNWAQSPV